MLYHFITIMEMMSLSAKKIYWALEMISFRVRLFSIKVFCFKLLNFIYFLNTQKSYF